MKILIMGLPGSGKTTLARELSECIDAVWWNADEVRQYINKHLGFSIEDRLQQARTMGWVAEQVAKSGSIAVCDFVCPTPEAREAYSEFGPPDLLIWLNTIDASRFADTNRIFIPPENPDLVIDYFKIVPDDRETQKPEVETLNRAINEILQLIKDKDVEHRLSTNRAV